MPVSRGDFLSDFHAKFCTLSFFFLILEKEFLEYLCAADAVL